MGEDYAADVARLPSAAALELSQGSWHWVGGSGDSVVGGGGHRSGRIAGEEEAEKQGGRE